MHRPLSFLVQNSTLPITDDETDRFAKLTFEIDIPF